MNQLLVIAVVAALGFVGLVTATADSVEAGNGCTIYWTKETVYDPVTGKPIATYNEPHCAW